MENFDEHLENEYRRRFEEFEEAPDDILWKNIQARIKPEKERPLVIWWNAMRSTAGIGIAASVLVGLLTGGYFLIQSDKPSQMGNLSGKPEIKVVQESESGKTQEKKSVKSDESTKQAIGIGNQAAENEPKVARYRGRTEQIKPQPIVEESKGAIAQLSAEKKDKINEDTHSSVINNGLAQETKIAKTIVADNTQTEETKTTLADNTPETDENSKTQATQEAHAPILANNSLSGANSTTLNSAEAKDTLFQNIETLKGKEAYMAVTEKKPEITDLPLTEIQIIEEEKRRLVFIPPAEVFVNVTSTLSYYVFSPNKADNILVNNFSSSSQRLGFAAQLGFVYPIAKKLDLRTGLSYFSGKSKISYGVLDNSQRSIKVLDDNSIQINPGNSTKNENRNWQYFEVQSDVLYEVKKMQALALGMKIGVQTASMNRPLLQARLGYRVSKAVAERWALWLEPTISFSLSSHNSLENLFMYRTTGLGLNMGVSLLR